MGKCFGMTNYQRYARYILLKHNLLPRKLGEGTPHKGAVLYPECRHIMTSGRKCQSPALGGKAYCYFHVRFRRPAPRALTPDQAIQVRAGYPLSPVDLPVLEDRGAIQMAISEVVHALASSQIEPRKAGVLLYGLQIASQNAARNASIIESQSVRTLTRTKDGEELGPVTQGQDLSDFDLDDEEDDQFYEDDEDSDQDEVEAG